MSTRPERKCYCGFATAVMLALTGCAPTLNLESARIPSYAPPSQAGSFNFDPRSALLNTEMGLVIHSAELSRQVTRIAEDAMRPERSYRPQLVYEPNNSTRLQWHDVFQGNERITDQEPDSTLIQRGLLKLLQALPIEEHL